ncbi:MAG: hypothetical protein KAT04_03645 [Methylococcales bacterium]|nr:hypothetical protein [Methylococcales bacterium]
MNYEERIISALQKTKELGLELKASPYPFKKALDHNEKQQALQLCADVLYSKGYRMSSDLASNCTPVHLMMQHFLKNELNLDSYITIGDRYWDDYIYCEMSYENIESELKSPNLSKPIKVHVWLTLSDGTILDCTAEAHADLLYKRGEHPIEKCLMLVEANNKENAKSGYHRPYLVGADFLEKIGVCQIVGQ